ncbi:uncharacterized protein DSM5745_07562 [Aspergillus mulundensis]|uniref:DUF676 domain-containing protein n=1 Tax=Aspergillus mulundensis TaxID=1810919 RepID=A0A3D8REI0_9EURO|nr:Uncharacterized protein DSM5745_07562 [Aspergillus mulundensis]RDW72390.1 Uncharacterized protein DSM5745_07562 [Aspergillus mulundensis]
MGLYESVIDTAGTIFGGADDRSLRKLLWTVFERIKRTPDLINPNLLVETVKSLAFSVLGSIFGAVGSVSSIREAVFRNEINATTLILLRDKAGDLAKFLLDFVEVAKCYYRADGSLQSGLDDEHVLYTEFNELDFSKDRNRHAAICQMQRLALSVIYILQNLLTPVAFKDIKMSEHTNLQSDRGIRLQETYTTRDGTRSNGGGNNRSRMEERHKKMLDPEAKAAISDNNEKWLFVNGIAGEMFWLELACNKLKAMFHRNITGVFNRGDGILWDLIECLGQRSSYVQNPDINATMLKNYRDGVVKDQRTMIEHTKSSKISQELLRTKLLQTLNDHGNGNRHIVMIAHSQGCLLLRHVLEDLIMMAAGDEYLRRTMRKCLCVFTFGNPSLHWKTQKPHPRPLGELDGTYLSSHVLRTEHFANSGDFVAKLGVLSETSDYGLDEVFINEEEAWIGHLFGTQYSMKPEHYKNSNKHQSWLLKCCFGTKISDVIARN